MCIEHPTHSFCRVLLDLEQQRRVVFHGGLEAEPRTAGKREERSSNQKPASNNTSHVRVVTRTTMERREEGRRGRAAKALNKAGVIVSWGWREPPIRGKQDERKWP